MNSKRMLTILVAALVTGSSVTVAVADTTKDQPVRPKTGLISSNVKGGERSTVVDTSEDPTPGGDYSSPPIAGSVSRLNPREWRMVIANNTEDPYSVDVTVRQINKGGSTVKNDHFSYTLRAGEQQTRTVSSAINAVDGRLVLNSWKNLAPKKAEKKEAPGAAAPEGAPATTN